MNKEINKAIDKTLEEMAELQFELLKYKKKPSVGRTINIQKETADLQIQLDRITNLFGKKQIKKFKQIKLDKKDGRNIKRRRKSQVQTN